MSTNTSNVFVDIKKILSLLPKKAEGDSYGYNCVLNELLNYARNNVGQLNIVQSKPTGNTIHSEMTLTLPEGKENEIKYFSIL